MLATPEMLASQASAVPAPGAAEPGPFQDVPRIVWSVFLFAWALLFGMFVLFFAVGAEASFAVTIAGLFAVMALGLPRLLAVQGRCEGHECGAVVQTHTGPLSIAAAGLQIVLIPIAAVIGLSAFIALAM